MNLIDIRFKNTICSILIIAFLSIVALIINANGDDFNAKGIILLTEFIAFFGSGLLFVLRFGRYIKRESNFLYNYFGTLNIMMTIFLIITGLINMDFFTLTSLVIVLINSLAGIFIMIDIFGKGVSK